MKYQIDENEIRWWWQTFHTEGDWVEVRLLNVDGKEGNTLSGYFGDADSIINALKKTDGSNVYVTIHELNDGVSYRKQREQIIKTKTTTSDNDIALRRYLFVDVDPKRPSGVSATDGEKAEALKVIENIKTYLGGIGFGVPIMVDSGNGYHLYYPLNPIEWDNNKENNDLVKSFIECLAFRFSDGGADVDKVVFNPSRVAKLVGTWSAKGMDTDVRPFRICRGMALNPEMGEQTYTPKELVKKVVEDNQVNFERVVPTSRTSGTSFNIDSFIREHGIAVHSDTGTDKGDRKIVLEQCPFDSSHKAPDSAIIVKADGSLGFKCFHNSCSNYHWKEFRSYYEPDYNPNFTQGSRRDVEYQTAKNNANNEAIAVSFWDEYKKQNFDDAYYQEQFERMGEGLKTGYCVKGESNEDIPIAFPCEGIDFISGISGHGKTALICNIILNILHDNPTMRVVYFAFEESVMKIIARFANINLCDKCSIPEKNNQQMIERYLKNKSTDFMEKEQKDEVISLIEEIKRLVSEQRLIIVRKNNFEDVNNLLPEIQNIPKAWNNEVCAIFIDHMGKLYENPKADRYMDIDHICGKLNDWSIENKVPVIVAVQFNKEVKNITTMTSQNIAEAWKITNNANYTLAIWNLSRKPIEDDEKDTGIKYGQSKCVLKVLKDRSGFIQEGQYTVTNMNGYTKQIERNDGITNHKMNPDKKYCDQGRPIKKEQTKIDWQ